MGVLTSNSDSGDDKSVKVASRSLDVLRTGLTSHIPRSLMKKQISNDGVG